MLNHIDLQGRLVRDPDLRRTREDTAVANFSLACNRDYKTDEVDFIDCVAWKGTAETIAKHGAKGRMVVVSGRLQMKKWKTNTGENRTGCEIVVDSFYFTDGGRQQRDDSEYAPEYAAYDAYSPL